MSKIRGYVDTRLIQEAIKCWPDLALIDSTTGQIEFVFKKAIANSPKKALELAAKNSKR